MSQSTVLEITKLRVLVDSLRTKYDQQLINEREENESLRLQLAQQKSSNNQTNTRNSEDESKYKNSEKELKELRFKYQQDIDELKLKLSQKEETEQSFTLSAQQTHETICSLKHENEKMKRELKDNENAWEQTNLLLKQFEDHFKTAKDRIEKVEGLSKNVEITAIAAKSKYESYHEGIQECRSLLSKFKTKECSFVERIQKLEEELKEETDQLNSSNERCRTLTENIQLLESKLEVYSKELERLQNALNNSSTNLQEAHTLSTQLQIQSKKQEEIISLFQKESQISNESNDKLIEKCSTFSTTIHELKLKNDENEFVISDLKERSEKQEKLHEQELEKLKEKIAKKKGKLQKARETIQTHNLTKERDTEMKALEFENEFGNQRKRMRCETENVEIPTSAKSQQSEITANTVNGNNSEIVQQSDQNMEETSNDINGEKRDNSQAKNDENIIDVLEKVNTNDDLMFAPEIPEQF